MTYSKAAKEAMQSDPSSNRHGKVSGYTMFGCRCDRCRVAQARYMRDYRGRKKADT